MIRTRIQPHLAPLPDPSEDDLSGSEKRMYGLALIAMIVGAGSLILLLRAIFFNALGEIDADTNYISVGFMVKSAALSIALFAFLALVVGRERTRAAWQNGKGMVAPLLIVFVVLGSIYGGITGITEAAGIGSVAVLILIVLRGEFSWTLLREASMRTFKSTGTIIWVTIGAPIVTQIIVPVDLKVLIEASRKSVQENSPRRTINIKTATEPMPAASVIPVIPP